MKDIQYVVVKTNHIDPRRSDWNCVPPRTQYLSNAYEDQIMNKDEEWEDGFTSEFCNDISDAMVFSSQDEAEEVIEKIEWNHGHFEIECEKWENSFPEYDIKRIHSKTSQNYVVVQTNYIKPRYCDCNGVPPETQYLYDIQPDESFNDATEEWEDDYKIELCDDISEAMTFSSRDEAEEAIDKLIYHQENFHIHNYYEYESPDWNVEKLAGIIDNDN